MSERRNGTFIVARKLYDGSDPIFGDEPFSRRDAWLWLIGAATFRDGHTRTINGTEVELDRGELVGSQRYFSRRWRWHRSKVRRFLDQLREHDRLEVVRDVDRVGTVYRLPSYDEWQRPVSPDPPTDPPSDPPTDPPEPRGGKARIRDPDPPSDPPTDPPSDPTKKEGKKKEGRKEVTEGSDTSLRSVSADQQPALHALAQDEPDTEKRATRALVGAWIELQPERPDGHEIRKQGAVAKRLAGRHAPRRLAVALNGMTRLYPYSDGEPWDLFDLERKFSKACNAGHTGGADDGSKTTRKKRSLYDLLS